MAEITIHLTDDEYAEALKAGFDAARKARFEDDNPEGAEAIGIEASQQRVREIVQRRLGK